MIKLASREELDAAMAVVRGETMTDDRQTVGDLLAEHVRERVARETTALDEAVWALLQAGAKIEHIVIQHWPNGMGDDPTPRTTVSAHPPTVHVVPQGWR